MSVNSRILTCLFFVFLCCFYLSGRVDFLDSHKKLTRDEFKKAFNSIGLYSDSQKVKDELQEISLRFPKFAVHESSVDIRLLAPIEFPGLTTSWILIVRIKNNVVVGKGIRVYEGWYRPCDAPIDQGEIEPSVIMPNNKICVL